MLVFLPYISSQLIQKFYSSVYACCNRTGTKAENAVNNVDQENVETGNDSETQAAEPLITKESEVHVAGESLNNVFKDESKLLKSNTAAKKNVKSVAPLKLDQKERNSSNINVEEILYIDYQDKVIF